MRFKKQNDNRDSTYGGFLSSFEYEAEIARREMASKRLSRNMTIALIVSVIIVTIVFTSFLVSASRFGKDPDRTPIDETEQPQDMPKRSSSAFPTAVYCISKTGFYGTPVSNEYAEKYNIPLGIKITVLTGTAENEGFRKDDIIVKLNNEPVHSAADAVKLLRSMETGDELSVLYFRAGNYYNLVSNVK